MSDNIQPDRIDNITILKNRVRELESEKAELIESIKKAISDLNEKGLNTDIFVGWVIEDLKNKLKNIVN